MHYNPDALTHVGEDVCLQGTTIKVRTILASATICMAACSPRVLCFFRKPDGQQWDPHGKCVEEG